MQASEKDEPSLWQQRGFLKQYVNLCQSNMDKKINALRSVFPKTFSRAN